MFETTEHSQGTILDFDIENRPLSYWWGDACTAEITAIAWSAVGSDEVSVFALDPPPDHETSMHAMLGAFVEAYAAADIVTGHFIRKHDLPIINAHLLEWGFAELPSKMTSDTKLDLTRTGSLSVSQESLDEMLRHQDEKVKMSQGLWRDANRLTPGGIEATIRRVHGDVVQHKAMRKELLKRGLLGVPRMWTP
jgi:hypothetical protein